MKLWLKLGVAGLVAVIPACSASHEDVEPSAPAVSVSEAIVHGALDKGRHPAVVALIAKDGATTHLCTAIVIAPDVLLTARHCVADLRTTKIECPARTSQVGRPLAAADLSVIIADDARGSAPVAYGRSIHTPYTDLLCDADIALVTLDRPLHIKPLVVARASRPLVGQSIVSVGYGRIGAKGYEGIRRFRASVPILSATATELVVGESTCSGDSGGPAIDETSGEVVGVLSRGSFDCTTPTSRNVYTQTAAYLDLIDRIAGPPPITPPSPAVSAPSDMGEPCYEGESCASGLCTEPGTDGYCSRPCGPDVGRCPTGYRCARRSGASSGVCARRT
jgi:hypothetical protein